MCRRALYATSLVTIWAVAACGQSRPTWTQLSLDTCGVDEFLAKNPKANGQGVVIAVFDTGVDPSIPGLTQTPDGQTKVIDLQDFSGEGDVKLHSVHGAEWTFYTPYSKDNTVVDYNDEGAPISYTLPADLPEGQPGEQRIFLLGFFEEKKFINSSVSDLNDNGETNDRFPILVTAMSGDGDDQAVAYVDTNLDRSFADEKPLHNYRLDYDTFTLARAKPEAQIEPMTFAVNIFLRKREISIVFDDGAHGTHVAGIAAGYRINNQEGFNGVAPGAKLMGLKIANNAIGGTSATEAKKKALAYVARYAREHNVPVVCNVSFGVGSTIEGSSAIDRHVNEVLSENPLVTFCTSAGNDGPGLSSIGTPSAGPQVIGVGALLAADTARDVQGFEIPHAIPTVFTSRGGELPKPDIATPGWETSTVPRYVKEGDFWAGTSMASPYAAGLCALVLSDAIQQKTPGAIRASNVKHALSLSAEPLPNTTPLDIGWGVPNAGKAAALFLDMTAADKDDPLLDYEITTESPSGYKGRAPAAFWRSTWFPTDEPQVFTIEPIFAPTADAADRTSFTRKFELRSNTPWCNVRQQSIYLRSEQSARVEVQYDAKQLTEPGLHTGTVDALYNGRPAFRLLNSVIVPYEFNTENSFARAWQDQTAKGWQVERYFVSVPAGATAMIVTLSAPQGKESKAGVQRIFTPEGYQLRDRSKALDTETGKREVKWTVTDELVSGVWEIDVVARRPDRDEPYDLAIRFFGLEPDPAAITEWSQSPGEPPSGSLTVTNAFNRPAHTRADGKVEGFRKADEGQFKGLKDELVYKINTTDNVKLVRVNLELLPEDFAETTDLAVEILDASGKALLESAMETETFTDTVDVPNPGEENELTLRLTAGFAIADDQRKTPIEVDVDHLLAEPVSIKVTRADASNITFVPGVPVEVDFALEHELPAIPAGLTPVGLLKFTERGSGETALEVPIEIDE